jgi:hypothetical protein
MRRTLCSIRSAFGVAALALPSLARAVQAPIVIVPTQAESVTVAAGARYQAGVLHRWFAGSAYRDLWATPIRVPVFDWSTYAGGLHPTKLGGGMQTKSLRFETAGGAEYVFRLSDKSVLSTPEQVQGTPAVRVFQDEISSLHPAAAAISALIVEASGILHPTAILMVMGNDSALGKYHGDFADRLGMIEEFPNVPKDGIGFGGTTKIIDSPELLHLLNTDARQHVDARAFLVARLTDFLINDNDRHPGNWKWARLQAGPKTQWEPIARDRDHAFVSYDGVLISIARWAKPSLVSFGNAPDVEGLTEPRMLDARLLGGLERPVWDSVTRALQSRITDAVIDSAAQAMPSEYRASAPRLAAVLKKRRDRLTHAAHQFYGLLAARAEVHGTDASDRAVIERAADDIVDVRLESEGKPYFSRRFRAGETAEILVYLHGGDDTAVVTGHVKRSIPVRIIGGNGVNTLIDSSTVAGADHIARLNDAGAVVGVSYGPDTMFDRRPWERRYGVLTPPNADDGTSYEPIAGLSFNRGMGATPRIGLVRYAHGFDQRPYASMVEIEGEYATKFQGARVGVAVDERLESSPVHFTALARMSDLEVVRFSGLGNVTIDSGSSNPLFAVHQRQWMLHPAVALAFGSTTDIALGPVLQHSVSDSARSPYVSSTRPYGAGTFNQVGMQLDARYEWRDVRPGEEHTHHRVLAEIRGLYVPAAMDVRSAFEAASANIGASITLPVPAQPFLVLRAGGKKVYGDFPFYQAATLGGDGSMRYMDTQHYAGDASLYGTSELRLPLVRFSALMPLRAGIMGLAEAGRVYLDGSSPGGWSSRTGGGVWVGRGDASPVVTLVRTTEQGRSGLQLGFGLAF